MSRAREVTIQLEGGEEIPLRLDFNAMARIEEQTGEPFFGEDAEERAKKQKKAKGQKDRSFSAKETRILVWACAAAYDEARGEEPTRTLQQIGALIGMGDIAAVSIAIAQLTVANLPEPKPKGEAGEEAGPPGGPTGP